MQTILTAAAVGYLVVALYKWAIVFLSYPVAITAMSVAHGEKTGHPPTLGYHIVAGLLMFILLFGAGVFWPYFMGREGLRFFMPYTDDAVAQECAEAVFSTPTDE